MMKLSNTVTVIILAISSTLASQAMAGKLIPKTDAELLVQSDATSAECMKCAAKELNKDLGYKVEFTFRNIASMDAASRIMQDGGTARITDAAEIEHDTLGWLVAAGGVMENVVSAERIKKTFIPGTVSAVTYNNINYGSLASFVTLAFLYNKDSLNTAPRALEEINAFSEKFNNSPEYRCVLPWDVQNYYVSRVFTTLYGVNEFGKADNDPKALDIASSEAKEGLETMKRLEKANPSNPLDMSSPQALKDLFNESKVAAMIDGPWLV